MFIKNPLIINICRLALSASLLFLVIAVPASAQITGPETPERLKNASDWNELCAVENCDQFPLGYNTYAFGPSVYYFPMMATMTVKPPHVLWGGVKSGRLFEVDENGELLRSLNASGSASISLCCHFLLAFYGLAEDMPVFQDSPSGNRMPAARLVLSNFDKPGRYNSIRRWLDFDLGSFPNLDEIISKDAVSYNDDFWVLGVGEVNGRGFRPFRLLSKRPLLHGRQVYVSCVKLCTFGTMSFAGSETETRPHIELISILLSGQNMFLCSPLELQNSCNPAPEIFDQVPVMLGLVEDMLVAAAVFPKVGSNQ